MAAIFGEGTFDPSTHAITMKSDQKSVRAMKEEAYISHYVPYFYNNNTSYL